MPHFSGVLSVGVAVITAVGVAGCDRERSDWNKTVTQNTAEAYDRYVSAHPAGPHVSEARDRAEQLREEADWKNLQHPPKLGEIENFLNRHANGAHAAAVAGLHAQAQFADDVARYVSAWDAGVSIPGNAPRFPDAAFTVNAEPFRTITISLAGKSLDGMIQVTGEGHFASDGRLARGTDAFKPVAIALAPQMSVWSAIKGATINGSGFLVVTDSASRSYEIRFGPSLSGSINALAGNMPESAK